MPSSFQLCLTWFVHSLMIRFSLWLGCGIVNDFIVSICRARCNIWCDGDGNCIFPGQIVVQQLNLMVAFNIVNKYGYQNALLCCCRWIIIIIFVCGHSLCVLMVAEGRFLAVQHIMLPSCQPAWQSFVSIKHENVRETSCRYGSNV